MRGIILAIAVLRHSRRRASNVLRAASASSYRPNTAEPVPGHDGSERAAVEHCAFYTGDLVMPSVGHILKHVVHSPRYLRQITVFEKLNDPLRVGVGSAA